MPLLKIPEEVLEQIVIHACSEPFLGPPTALATWLAISKSLNTRLNLPFIHAQIFAAKFDLDAPIRRLGTDAVNQAVLHGELRKRCQMLRRLKARTCPGSPPFDDSEQLVLHDLWLAYLMMLESDGRNERQLIEYARVDHFACTFIRANMGLDNCRPDRWPSELETHALAIWLLWFTRDAGMLPFISPALSSLTAHRKIQPTSPPKTPPNTVISSKSSDPMSMLASWYVIDSTRCRFSVYNTRLSQFPATYAQFNLWRLPLQNTDPVAAGIQEALSRQNALIDPRNTKTPLHHFGRRIEFNPPLLIPAATLVFTSRNIDPWDEVSYLPYDAADALAQGQHPHPSGVLTQVAVNAFKAVSAPRYLERCTPDAHGVVAHGGSRRHDMDFARLVSCVDLLQGGSPFLRPSLQPGMLSGLWDGKIWASRSFL